MLRVLGPCFTKKAAEVMCTFCYSVTLNGLFHFAGIVFYQEFEGLALLNIGMFLFG